MAALNAYPLVGYKTMKAAVVALTENLAAHNAAHGVRANAILPGLMNTPMAIEARVARGTAREEVIASRDKRVPLRRRMGTGWDVAYAALYLHSDEALSLIINLWFRELKRIPPARRTITHRQGRPHDGEQDGDGDANPRQHGRSLGDFPRVRCCRRSRLRDRGKVRYRQIAGIAAQHPGRPESSLPSQSRHHATFCVSGCLAQVMLGDAALR